MGCCYKATADNNRRKILKILSKGNATAGDIANKFKVSQPTISNHLKILKEAGLIKEQRVKQNRIYSINKGQVRRVRTFLETLLEES